MSEHETVFLETTMQIDRFYSIKATREAIKHNLANKKLVSSSYVLGEFTSNMIKDTITYYTLLSDEASETPMDALVRLAAYGGFRPRIYNRIHKILSSLANDVHDKELLKIRLEMLIERVFVARFKQIDVYLDETKCVRAEPSIEKEENTYGFDHGCRKKACPNCNIVAFFERYEDEVKKIIQNGKPEDIIAVLSKIDNGEDPVGRTCWSIGDAVISLEVPKEIPIYTSNIKDYEPICSVIDKNLI